jgi:putative FmdB family regulatory protein
MPRYRYNCEVCHITQMIFHMLTKPVIVCPQCGAPNRMKKLLTIPTIVGEAGNTPDGEVGELTKEYIESNRDVLKQQKEEAKKETYEPS